MKREEFIAFLRSRGVRERSAARAWEQHKAVLERAEAPEFDRALACMSLRFVLAHRPGRLDRANTWLLRHPVWCCILGAVAGTSIALLLFSLVQGR